MRILYSLVLIFCAVVFTAAQDFSAQNQLDLNNATYEDIRRLPIPVEIAGRLYERVQYKGFFKSIFELREVEGIDQELLNKLKPLLRIEPFRPKSSWEEKAEEIYYQLDRWTGSEGINDALLDLWIEKSLNPLNVNTIRYNELINLQNVSPIDAVAVMNYRAETGEIRNARDLRGVPGLSYYGYRNARRFLEYSDRTSEESSGLHGHITARLDDTPFFTEEDVASSEVSAINLEQNLPSFGSNFLPNFYYKMRFTYDQKYKFGYSYTRNLNEPNFYHNLDLDILSAGKLRIPRGKVYLGAENIDLGGFNMRKIYVGNYSLSLGQGVVMDNTDFFTPRKSGYGFRKRFNGISGDNSQTREFALRGIATEIEYDKFSGIFFGSFTSRDAILNKQVNDSTLGRGFNQLVVLNQRFTHAPDDGERGPGSQDLPWLNTVRELTYGTHLQYDFFPGTYVGFSFYESAYDRPIEPHPDEIVAPENLDRLVDADNEIRATYGFDISQGSNPFWNDAVSFRRVYGFDFQTVYKNIVIQGEYGELDKGGGFFTLGDDPKAMVFSIYTQFNNLNVLALYRRYDLGFDNPYQRSFSNYRRFKGTIYEDYFYLQSSLYGQLYSNGPQPQAEEGYYLSTRYQFNRNLTMRLEYDNWTRLADQARQFRMVGTLDIRPVFPLRIQLRQKWQARNKENDLTLGYFENFEFRGRMDVRLSGFNSFNLIYATSRLIVHPRPRVFGDLTPESEAIGAGFTHNFNRYLKLRAMLAYYRGFFWNFEETQFVVLESDRGALRTWWSVYARLNNNFSIRMKYTLDYQQRVTNIAFTDVRDAEAGRAYGTDFRRGQNSFFYLEFNYNF